MPNETPDNEPQIPNEVTDLDSYRSDQELQGTENTEETEQEITEATQRHPSNYPNPDTDEPY